MLLELQHVTSEMQEDFVKRCQRVNLTLSVVRIFAFVLLFNKYIVPRSHHCCLTKSISLCMYILFFPIHSDKI